MLSDFAQPLVLNVVIGCPVGDVEHKKDAIATLVEVTRNWSERLLASRVPYLQLNVSLLTHNHSEVTKLHPDGHTLMFFEGLSSQSFKDASFANSSLAYYYDFEKHVKVVHDPIEVRLILDRDACWKVVDLRVKVGV